MAYRALILDLDGTTIPHTIDGLPSSRVISAIRKAKERVFVSIATGRPLYKAAYLIDSLKLTGLSILANGIHVYNPVTRKIIREIELPAAAVTAVTATGKRHGLTACIFDGVKDRPYTDTTTNTKVLGMYFPDIDPERTDMVRTELSEIPGVAVHVMPSWTKGFMSIDITDVKASKLQAVNFVMRQEGIKRNEVIAVGDSFNDFPLLMAAGLKVAMGNAVSELKEIADFIAPTVDNDGVAEVIDRFILNS